MARSKEEIISELKELGATQSESSLKKKSVEKLEEMLAELKAKGETETKEDVKETVDVKETKEELTELTSMVHQLRIFTEFIYHVKNEGATVKVENLGYGDAYVNSKPIRVGDKESRLLKDEVKTFKDVKVLYMIAASQPELKITELK